MFIAFLYKSIKSAKIPTAQPLKAAILVARRQAVKVLFYIASENSENSFYIASENSENRRFYSYSERPKIGRFLGVRSEFVLPGVSPRAVRFPVVGRPRRLS